MEVADEKAINLQFSRQFAHEEVTKFSFEA